MADAIRFARENDKLDNDPLLAQVASVSVGVCDGRAVLDLDYDEDSSAETDMNVVMNDQGGFIEIQGTAEGHPFSMDELNNMLGLASKGIKQLFELQSKSLAT